MLYKGSCHCGRIAFEAEGDLNGLVSCNCSICSRKGALMWFVSKDHFKLLTPEEAASSYTFNKHVIHHRFCPVCGIHPYGEGITPQGMPMIAINARCLDDVDLSSIPVKEFDGRAI